MKITCCTVCGSSYSSWSSSLKNQNRQPLIVRCGHTFCESCLSQRMKRSPSSVLHQFQVACPTCKTITLLENGVKDLPVNIYLCAYIEISQRGKLDQQLGAGVGQFVPASKLVRPLSVDADQKCKMCAAKIATCKCAECDSMLCSTCFEKMHNMSAAIKHHKPIQLSTPPTTELETEAMCPEHNRILEYFCEDDLTSICSRCYIIGKHQNHSIVSIEEKNKHIFEAISSELPKAKLVLQHLNKIDKKIIATMPSGKSETKSLIESISNSFFMLHSLLQAREIEIINEVNLAYKTHLLSIDQKRESFEKSRCELEDTIRKSSKLLENNTLLLDGRMLLATLKKAQKIPCISVKTEAFDEPLKWIETQTQLADMISSYGSIVGAPPIKLEFKTIEEASDHYEEEEKTSTNCLHSEAYTQPVNKTVIDNKDKACLGNANKNSDIKTVDTKAVDTIKDQEISPIGFKEDVRWNITLPVEKGPAQKVMVTHIRSPNDFCVQLTCNQKQLDTLSREINIWCHRNLSVKQALHEVKIDAMVLARYSADKQWYRAQVLNVEPAQEGTEDTYKVHVRYIDFGNDEVISIKELRAMQKRFMKYPVFCLQCSLYDIAPIDEDLLWSLESVQEFHRMTQNQKLIMTTMSMQGNVYEVDLSCIPMADAMDDNYVSVRDILIFMEFARFRTFSDTAVNVSALPSYSKTDYIKPTAIKNGQTLGVIITHVTSPSKIYLICKGEEHDYYLTMHDDMQEMYNKDHCNIYSLFFPRMDMVCAAKGKNGQWYRAKIFSPPVNKEVSVIFVDLGTKQTVQYDCLKKLHTNFIKLPIQAISCQLVDVCPTAGPTSNWPDSVTLWCVNNLSNAEGHAKFIRYGQDTQVVLWLNNVLKIPGILSINSVLVEQGFAISTGPSSVKSSKESKISSDFCDNKNVIVSPRSDSSVETYSCLFSKTVMMRNAPSFVSAAKNKPPLSVHIQSKKKDNLPPDKLKTLKPDAAKKSSSPVRRLFKTVKSNEDKQRIQQEIHNALNNDGQLITDAMYIEVVVCTYVSPSEFYVQMQETRDDLNKLMVDMHAAFANSEPIADKTWSVNEYCASKFSTDGVWCRANILSEVSPEKYEIEYVDFGNVDIVPASHLRPLPAEFGSRIPCAAARCFLANVMPAGSNNINEWSKTASEFVAALLKDRKLYIKQEGDPTEIGLPVDLIMEEEIPETAFEPKIQCYSSVKTEVINNGLAMPLKKQAAQTSVNTSENKSMQRFSYKGGASSHPNYHHPEQNENIDFNKNSLPVSETNVKSSGEVSQKMIILKAETLSIPPYPLPEPGVEVTVVPTYVDSDGIIYAQPMIWEGKCVHLSSELQRAYGQISPVITPDWKVGQMCVSLFPEDKFWYRSKILEIQGDKIKVNYIDFGNSTWVKSSHLVKMQPAFAKEHALAYRCVLHDLETVSPTKIWPAEVLEYITKMIVNQLCTIIPVESETDMPIKIQLIKGDINLSEHLISNNMAMSCVGLKNLCDQSLLIAHVLANQNPYHVLEAGDVGDSFKCFMVHAELPDVIYLQRGLAVEPEEMDFVKASEVAEINNSIREFVSMADRLKVSKLLPVSQLPDVGLMCAALFSSDDHLYRALCIERFPEMDSCLVLFVDYGTSEVVARNKLKLLPSEFWSVPAQAIRCNISALSSQPTQTSHHLFAAIIKTLVDKELLAKIVSNNPFAVELMVEDNGKWLIPYKHLFEDNVEQMLSSEVVQKDKVNNTAGLIELHEVVNMKEKWNDDSDDDNEENDDEDDDDSITSIMKGKATEIIQMGITNNKTLASSNTGRDTRLEMLQIESALTAEVEDASNRDSDEDDVDWVAIAAKLVEDSQKCKTDSEVSKEV